MQTETTLEFGDVADEDTKKQFLYMGHFFAIFSALFGLIVIGIRKKIMIALGILTEAGNAIGTVRVTSHMSHHMFRIAYVASHMSRRIFHLTMF